MAGGLETVRLTIFIEHLHSFVHSHCYVARPIPRVYMDPHRWQMEYVREYSFSVTDGRRLLVENP